MRTTFLRPLATAATAIALIASPAVASTAAPLTLASAHVATPAALTLTDLEMSVGTISAPIVAPGGAVTIKPARASIPQYSGKVLSSTLTVKNGTKLVGKANAAQVSLKAGSYLVTTTFKVEKQYPKKTHVVASTQKLTVSAAATLKAPAVTRGKITPNVTAAKGAEVTSKKLSIKQGKKTVKKDVPSASLPKGTYQVTTTAKYKYSYADKVMTYGFMGTVKDPQCTVTKLGPLRDIVGYTASRGQAKNIEWSCVGNFDGKVTSAGLLYPLNDVNKANGYTKTLIELTDVEGRRAFANPKITASVKNGQKFTQTFMSGTPLYKTTIVKGTGTTQATHTVRVK